MCLSGVNIATLTVEAELSRSANHCLGNVHAVRRVDANLVPQTNDENAHQHVLLYGNLCYRPHQYAVKQTCGVVIITLTPKSDYFYKLKANALIWTSRIMLRTRLSIHLEPCTSIYIEHCTKHSALLARTTPAATYALSPSGGQLSHL